MFLSQGCGDSDPCGDSGHCAVIELNRLEPSLLPHPCADTPTCAILIETKALLWGVSNAHPCAKTATCAIKNKNSEHRSTSCVVPCIYSMALLQQRVDHKQHNHTHTNGTRRNNKNAAELGGVSCGLYVVWLGWGDVRRPIWICGYYLPFSMKTMKET